MQEIFQKIINSAIATNAWRIFPRLFITIYLILLYQVINWFMTLPEPTTTQSAFVSIVVGAGAVWFGIYTNTGGIPKIKD